jgi:hypothetical protein
MSLIRQRVAQIFAVEDLFLAKGKDDYKKG